MAYELSVVVPTLNEVGNVEALVGRLTSALRGIDWELLFVDDDSQDGTLRILRDLARKHANVHCLQRIGRRGLASAAIEGMLAASSPYIAVMDADLQHDESVLPDMLERLKRDGVELVVGSRFVEGATTRGLTPRRERLSRIGNVLSRLIIKTKLSDPLGGFFLLSRELIHEVAHSLSGEGYKILLDILASANRPVRVTEVPLTFRQRHSGSSKLDVLVALEFALLIGDKLFGKLVPVRFVLFVIVGLIGALLHVTVLGLFFKGVQISFYAAQAVATLLAMTSNFYFNNEFTHRDRRLSGLDFSKGLFSFYFACSVGAVANLQLAQFLYAAGLWWPLAGLLGAVVGSVWNYGVTSTLIWRRRSA